MCMSEALYYIYLYEYFIRPNQIKVDRKQIKNNQFKIKKSNF